MPNVDVTVDLHDKSTWNYVVMIHTAAENPVVEDSIALNIMVVSMYVRRKNVQ